MVGGLWVEVSMGSSNMECQWVVWCRQADSPEAGPVCVAGAAEDYCICCVGDGESVGGKAGCASSIT